MMPFPEAVPFPDELAEISTASEDFKANILEKKRYVDKTMALLPLLRRTHESTFLLRPRRFGKTLMLSMIRYFVEDTRDEALNAENRHLFDGLNIMSAGPFYTAQMTRYPVIRLSLQNVKGHGTNAHTAFLDAYQTLREEIQNEYERHLYVLESDTLTERNKKDFRRVWLGEDPDTGKEATRTDYKASLQRLAYYLRLVHGQKTVLLLDEYDVPLEHAQRCGYDREMNDMIGSLLQNVLRTNAENLQFAVIVGCLHVAASSIEPCLSHSEFNSVMSAESSNWFGFTEEEVQGLLSENGLSDHAAKLKAFYGGYRFGQTKIYNPWSVLRHIEELRCHPQAIPETYWMATSGNHILRKLADMSSETVKEQIGILLHGGTIRFRWREQISFSEAPDEEELFNIMLSTGYLTCVSFDGHCIEAGIPNQEVKIGFQREIQRWFDAFSRSFDAAPLYHEFLSSQEDRPHRIRRILEDALHASIDCYDSEEAYVHAVPCGLLSRRPDFAVHGHYIPGQGHFDIECLGRRACRNLAIILQVRIVKAARFLHSSAVLAASQSRIRKSALAALSESRETVYTYGIAFFEKQCDVVPGPVCTEKELKEITSP